MISIYDAATGETIVREETDDERAEREGMVFPASSYRIGKSTPWRRMTDAEAELTATAIQAQPVREQMIYNAASYIDSGDPLYAQLRQLLSALHGETRADELLAPETADVDQP